MGEPAMTVAEALSPGVLDPPIPRRSLTRRLTGVQPVGVRKPGTEGGRPALLYAAADIYRVHAEWARSTRGKRGPACATG